jgi:hypothetical protein
MPESKSQALFHGRKEVSLKPFKPKKLERKEPRFLTREEKKELLAQAYWASCYCRRRWRDWSKMRKGGEVPNQDS